MTATTVIKQQARRAGWLYLLLAATGAFSLLYLPKAIFVAGDPTATASNLKASEQLLRLSIFSGLVSQLIFIFLVLALYRLFKQTDRKLAELMVTLVVVSVATGFVVTLIQLGALIALNDQTFTLAFDQPQREATAYGVLRAYTSAVQGVQILWGLWLFPFGLLVYRSEFIPRAFGVLLIIAGVGYVLASFVSIAMPALKQALAPVVTILELGELPIIFWLAIIGARTDP